jgi:hypothetical protein
MILVETVLLDDLDSILHGTASAQRAGGGSLALGEKALR